jgi:hypothetical protein
MGNIIDIAGMRFGKLVVVERAESFVQPSGQIKTAWKCKCDCGREHIANGYFLRKGKIKSCGVCGIQKADIGDTFGYLTIISGNKRINGKTYLDCECKCGNKCTILRASILSGNTKSCGCYAKEVSHKRIKSRLYNKFEIKDDYAIIYSTNGSKSIVDIDDVKELVDMAYWIDTSGYMVAKINGERVYMHRVVSKCPEGYVTDHINHNTFDNRKSNLRICTPYQNSLNHRISSSNTSGTTGVYYLKKNKKWLAMIGYKGKKIRLGVYVELEDAINARKEAEKKYFGEFANKEE